MNLLQSSVLKIIHWISSATIFRQAVVAAAILFSSSITVAEEDLCVPGEPQFEFPTVGAANACDGVGQIEQNPDGTYRWRTSGTLGSYCWQQLFLYPSYYDDPQPLAPSPLTSGSGCSNSFYEQFYLPNVYNLHNGGQDVYPYGFRTKFNPLAMPGLGTFMPPAEDLQESSVALVPPGMGSKELSWNGASRATLHGQVDLVTGMPLQKVNQLEIPFDGATFRLVRTRSGSRDDMQKRTDDQVNYGGISDHIAANERWWDWAGQGWMISENPLLLVDSALPGPVGPQPVTTYLMLDAHHTIPFQQIESTGQYAAPPRFRARLEHNGIWDDAVGGWTEEPTQYDVYLYDGELKYSFVVVREDIPQHLYEVPGTNTGLVPGSYHQRPVLPGYGAASEDYSPWADCKNPGLGIPYIGLCFRIEDQYGHEVRINYSDVTSQELDMSDTEGCIECSQSCQKKGMISSIELVSDDQILWTLVYSYRGMYVSSSPGNNNPQMNNQYPENMGDNATLYNKLWGGYHINQIHVLDRSLDGAEGAEFDIVQQGLTLDHRDAYALDIPNSADAGELGQSAFFDNPDMDLVEADWVYRVRNHYLPNNSDSNDRMWRAGLKAMTTVTERFVDEQGGFNGQESKDRWVFQYTLGNGSEPGFPQDGHANPPSESSKSIRWLSRMYTPEDLDDLIEYWMADPDGRPDKEQGQLVYTSGNEIIDRLVRNEPIEQNGSTGIGIRSVAFASAQWLMRNWEDWGGANTPDPHALVNNVPGVGRFVTRKHERLHSDNYERTVESVIARDESGVKRRYQISRIRVSPFDSQLGDNGQFFGAQGYHFSVVEQQAHIFLDSGDEDVYNYHQKSVFYAPFKWQHVKYDNDNTQYSSMVDSPDLTQPRWIVIVDELPNEGHFTGEAYSSGDASLKPGQLSRRVVEMSASGHVLTDKLWEFTPDGIVRSGGGLGEQYIYMSAKDYFDLDSDPSNDIPSVPTSGGDDFAAIRNESLLVEYRSVGYSVESDQDTGLTRFIDYKLFNPVGETLRDDYGEESEDDIPLIHRIQPVAEGIRKGVSFEDYDLDGTLLSGESTHPKLYKSQTFRSESNPFDVTGAVEYVNPTQSSSLLSDMPVLGQVDANTTPNQSFRVLYTVIERDDEDEDIPVHEQDILSRMVVGVPKQAYPGSPYYYPVEREFYDPDTGYTIWSCTGQLRDPNNPSGYNDPHETLIFTYYDRDSQGRSVHTVLDADIDANNSAPIGDKITSSNPHDADPIVYEDTMGVGDDGSGSAWPTSQDGAQQWRRLSQTPALQYVTSYKYHSRHGLVDAFFPSGRRWAKRVIRITGSEAGIDWDQGVDREFIFSDLERMDLGGPTLEWVTNSEGEVNDYKRNTGRTQHPPISSRRVRFNSIPAYTNGNGDIRVSSNNRPEWVVKNSIKLALDANGRLQEARLLERSANGQLLAVGTKQINDLGALYREQEIDGTITIQTRNALGQTLRTYKGTLSGDPFGIGAIGDPDNMVLVNRTQYGSTANDAWLPTVVRRYDRTEGWHKDHQSPYEQAGDLQDQTSMPTVISYDWQNRAVRTDTYARGVLSPDDNVYPQRLSTTLTYLDYSDRAYLEVVYGADPVPGTVDDPGTPEDESAVLNLSDIDPAEYINGTYFPGHNPEQSVHSADVGQFVRGLFKPISVNYTIYSLNGTAIERRQYDPADLESASPQYHASYSYNGIGGQQVYSQSPGAPIGYSVLDGLGRVSVEYSMEPSAHLVHGGTVGPEGLKQLSMTEYGYDADGNVVEIINWVRTQDDQTLELTGANAVRTRTKSWYNAQKRLIATADLGTENLDEGYKTPDPIPANLYSSSPTWDFNAGDFDRNGVPDYALISLNEYDEEGNMTRTVNPNGIATTYEYSNTNRMLYKTENADAPNFNDRLMTAYRYQYGRLISMSQVTEDRRFSPIGAMIPPVSGNVPEVPAGSLSELDMYGDIDLSHTTGVEYGAQVVNLNGAGTGYTLPTSYDNSMVGSLFMPDPDTGEMSDAADVILRYTKTGQIAERFDASGGAFRYFYDEFDRLIEIEAGFWDPSEPEPGFQGSDIGDTEPSPALTNNSAIPEMDEPTDKIGFIEYVYDNRSQLAEVIAWTARDGPDKRKISHSSMDYDQRGMLLAERQGHGEVDALLLKTPATKYEWSYEPTSNQAGEETGHHRLASIEYPVPTPSVNSRKLTMQYGASGSLEDLLSRISGMNSDIGTVNVADFTYTADGRRSSLALKNGRITNDHRIRNEQGQLISTGGLAGHDVLGRMTQEDWIDNSGGGSATLYKGEYGFDAIGNRITAYIQQVDLFTDSGIPGLEVSRNNVRSTLSAYDDLNRLVSVQIGQLDVDQSGNIIPALVSGTTQYEDSWNLDAVGNWVADVNPATGAVLNHGRESDGILETSEYTNTTLTSDQITRTIDQDVTWRDSISVLTDTTTADGQTTTVGGDPNGVVPIYDGAGRLRFDGQYSYQYDTWGRLVQINRAVPALTDPDDPESLDTYEHLALVKHYVYDGVGRLIRTTSPIDGSAGDLQTVDFYYDGVRRIQEIINTPVLNAMAASTPGSGLQGLAAQTTTSGEDTATATMGLQGGQLDPQLSRNIHREYVWGPGDGGVDEILLQTDEADEEYWCIQDAGGDLVALAVVDGQNPAQVVRQWTYGPYGEVLTSDHLGASIESHIGHKGLFLDRIDPEAPVTTGPESPRLVPDAHASYHNRNRTYQPTLGRFLQMDPNASGMALMSASASHGSGIAALGIAFSMQGMLGDGMNLYQYLGGNPWARSDPMGLSYDPWAEIDIIIGEYVAARSGVYEVLTEFGRGAALAASFIATLVPFPPVWIAGELGLYFLGSPDIAGRDEFLMLTTIRPGSRLLLGTIKGLQNMVSRIATSAPMYLTKLAMGHSSIMKSLAGLGGKARSAPGWVGTAIQNAARKARAHFKGACGCFTAATLVMTANGAVPIVDIEEGQQVLAAPDDGLAGSYSSNTVGTKIVVGEANLVQLIVLHEDGSSEVINTTDEHPFHVADTAEWTRADGLIIGNQLSTITGTAELLGVVHTTERVPVYNLSIPGTPTYYVGEHGVWVHNCGWKDAYHHLIPKFMGGAVDGGTTKLSGIDHRDVHRKITDYLFEVGGPKLRTTAAIENWVSQNPVVNMGKLKNAIFEAYSEWDTRHGTTLAFQYLSEVARQGF